MIPTFLEISAVDHRRMLNLANCSRIEQVNTKVKFVFDHLVEETKYSDNVIASQMMSSIWNIVSGDLWVNILVEFINLDRVSCVLKLKSDDKKLMIIFDGSSYIFEFDNPTDRETKYQDIRTLVLAIPSTQWMETATLDRLISTGFLSIIKKTTSRHALRFIFSDQLEQTIEYDTEADAVNDYNSFETIADPTISPYPSYNDGALGGDNV